MQLSDGPIVWESTHPGADWHPDIRAIFGYWHRIKPPGRLPGRQHFDPMAIMPVLPALWLLDVQPEPFRLRYRLVGTRVVESIGREVTGLWMDEAHPDIASSREYFSRYRQVWQTATPSWRRGRPQFAIHRDFEILENLMLPLSTDGVRVDIILAGTAYYAPAASDPATEASDYCRDRAATDLAMKLRR